MTLAPVIPELVLDTMVKEFEAGTRLGMVTTLPFGLKAALNLRPSPAGGRDADGVAYNRSRFETPEPLEGAIQLVVQAEGGTAQPGAPSPSFEGATAQLLNGVDLQSGDPLGISVLGATRNPADSVETVFNREFADQRPRVPLTRLDVSGYGSSTFSDWQNPFGAFAEATKVEFQVMVGRTALEVVKVASVIYPWGIRATRSVTIERRGGGGVIRRDSGWQAQTPGEFDFRWKDKTGKVQPSKYTFHPGLLRGLFDVSRIRASDRPPVEMANTAGEPFLVSPIFFDAQAAIDGVAGRATTRGVLGFLHLSPVGEPLSPEALATLITQQSAIGGPVDATLNVGGSGFRTRALRIEVDLARKAGAPHFVGVVRGTPVFGPSGAWSVVRFPGAVAPSAPPDLSIVEAGAPLIRTRCDRQSDGRIADSFSRRPGRHALQRCGRPFPRSVARERLRVPPDDADARVSLSPSADREGQGGNRLEPATVLRRHVRPLHGQRALSAVGQRHRAQRPHLSARRQCGERALPPRSDGETGLTARGPPSLGQPIVSGALHLFRSDAGTRDFGGSLVDADAGLRHLVGLRRRAGDDWTARSYHWRNGAARDA